MERKQLESPQNLRMKVKNKPQTKHCMWWASESASWACHQPTRTDCNAPVSLVFSWKKSSQVIENKNNENILRRKVRQEIEELAEISSPMCFKSYRFYKETLGRNPPEVRVTSKQKLCTEIIYIVLQNFVRLF